MLTARLSRSVTLNHFRSHHSSNPVICRVPATENTRNTWRMQKKKKKSRVAWARVRSITRQPRKSEQCPRRNKPRVKSHSATFLSDRVVWLFTTATIESALVNIGRYIFSLLYLTTQWFIHSKFYLAHSYLFGILIYMCVYVLIILR